MPLLALAALTIVATDSIGQRLQRFADSVVAARPGLPGFLIYARDGGSNRTWKIAAGWSDPARKVPLHPDQPLRIASNTKTYTAAAILRLMEQGKLALSDPLAKHLPTHLNAMLTADGYQTERITIEQVLSHRAGLDEHVSVPSYVTVALQSAPTKHWTREEQVRWLVDSLQPIGAPGERFKYSDTGYILLGAIIERYTGTNLGAAVRDLIGFRKLGLERTWFESLEPIPADVRPRVHQHFGGKDAHDYDPSFDLYGGGGIAAPLEDLGRFIEALVSGRVFERAATLDTMLRPRSPEFGGYGLGIYGITANGRHGFGHSGFWGTNGFYFPAEQVTIAIAVTEQSEIRLIASMVPAVFGILFPGTAAETTPR